MRRHLYPLLILLFVCSACGKQSSFRTSALLDRAQESYKAGAYESTIADTSQVIKTSPTDKAYYLRAMAYLGKGNYTKAFSDFNDALRLNPNQIDALVQRGGIYNKLQQYDNAIADLTKAIQLDPAHVAPQALVERGDAYAATQQFSQAQADYDQALKQDSNNVSAYLGQANLFRLQGKYEKAINNYNRSLQIAPKSERAFAGRGDAYFFTAQYSQAQADYDKAISLTSDDDELALLYTARADALFMLGMYDEAVEGYTKAIELNPRVAEPYAGRGAALSTLNQLDKAGADFNAAVKYNPSRPQNYINRGDLYFLRGKYQAAIDDYTTALKLGIKDETRRTQVEQQRTQVQTELKNEDTEDATSLSLCTWFARAQFMRTTRLNQMGNFKAWQQTYGTQKLTSFDQAGFKALIELLRNYEPYQKKFIKQWSTLTPPVEAKSYWEKELQAIQQEFIATSQMLDGYDAQDMHKFETGLVLWQEAAPVVQAAEQEMLGLRTQCLR